MLEIIGSAVIIYLAVMGLDYLIRGKRPKREYYLVQEYEIEDDGERRYPKVAKLQPGSEPEPDLPDNVIPLRRAK